MLPLGAACVAVGDAILLASLFLIRGLFLYSLTINFVDRAEPTGQTNKF